MDRPSSPPSWRRGPSVRRSLLDLELVHARRRQTSTQGRDCPKAHQARCLGVSGNLWQ
jgi:hypothetical protein